MTSVEEVEEICDWWSLSSRDVFIKAHEKLISLGLSRDESIEFLTDLYIAISSEYGE